MKIYILVIVVIGIVYFSLCGQVAKKADEIVKKQNDKVVMYENLLNQ